MDHGTEKDRRHAKDGRYAKPAGAASVWTAGLRAGVRYALAVLAASGMAAMAHADITVDMHSVDAQGVGKSIGSVRISESQYGLVFTPDLQGLPPGIHGFHVHEHPSCDPAKKDGKAVAAQAAGGHLDPEKTGKHGFPWGRGHLGDLPALYVDAGGKSNNPVLAPRLTKLDQVSGHALMVHEGGDNHADHPKPLGGGAGRLACGIIKK